jgi:RNA polymerase sigma-70 factor (ECF subfamily)
VFDDELVNQLADDAVALAPVHDGHREALEHCLEKLPAAQRELVLTAYTKGTRMDELATRRGQTPMALYKLLHRIRQALLECVERTLAQEKMT